MKGHLFNVLVLDSWQDYLLLCGELSIIRRLLDKP